jgi:hypothetical protein
MFPYFVFLMFLFSLVFVFKTDSQTREVFSKNGFAVLETENLFPKQQPNRLCFPGQPPERIPQDRTEGPCRCLFYVK